MTTKCKLTYFPVTGLGEPIRWLLYYGNIKFEDYRFTPEEWVSIKPTMPFGKVPVLEIDGKTLHQTTAICRYLAKKVGLQGKDDDENVEIDILVDTFTDFRQPIRQYFFDKDQKSKSEKYDPLIKDTLPYYLEKFDAIVKKNGGYFVGGRLTWTDIYFVGLLPNLNTMVQFDIVEKYDNLKALRAKVQAIPQIAAFVTKASN